MVTQSHISGAPQKNESETETGFALAIYLDFDHFHDHVTSTSKASVVRHVQVTLGPSEPHAEFGAKRARLDKGRLHRSAEEVIANAGTRKSEHIADVADVERPINLTIG